MIKSQKFELLEKAEMTEPETLLVVQIAAAFAEFAVVAAAVVVVFVLVEVTVVERDSKRARG